MIKLRFTQVKIGVLVTLNILLLLSLVPHLVSMACLNMAAHELVIASSDAPILFPYALDVRDLANTRKAIMLADQGRSLNP